MQAEEGPWHHLDTKEINRITNEEVRWRFEKIP